MATTKQILYYWLEGHNVGYVPAMTDSQMLVGVTNGTPTPTTISGDVTFSGGVTAIGAEKVTNAMLAAGAAAGQMSIGTHTPQAGGWQLTLKNGTYGVYSETSGGYALYGQDDAASGATYGVYGLSASSSGHAVQGENSSSGVGGYFTSTSGLALQTGTGDVSFGGALTCAGKIKGNTVVQTAGYTVATLPAAGAGLKGAIAYVTDALAPAFLTVVVGGGAVVCPVFCDGTNWIGG